jgi:hypothetical protein
MYKVAMFTLGVLFILGGIVSTLLMLYYFFSMLGCVKPEKRRLIQFLGPFMLLFPQLWDDRGNRARKLTILFALLFGVCLGAEALIMHLPK